MSIRKGTQWRVLTNSNKIGITKKPARRNRHDYCVQSLLMNAIVIERWLNPDNEPQLQRQVEEGEKEEEEEEEYKQVEEEEQQEVQKNTIKEQYLVVLA